MIKDIDFKKGKITYNDFNIDSKIPFKNQEFSFKEDILQVNYPQGYLLDVGWYPEFNPKGKFTIYIIKNCDWSNPIAIKKTKSLETLKKILLEFIDLISERLEQNL